MPWSSKVWVAAMAAVALGGVVVGVKRDVGAGALRWWVLVAALAGCLACGGPTPERPSERGAPPVVGEYDTDEMDAAIAQARGTLDKFVQALADQDGSDFSVKVHIEQGSEGEHLWVAVREYRDGAFHGEIGNEPVTVTNVKLGQEWSVATPDVEDWVFMRDGKLHGNYTLRPLLKSMPPEEAAAYREMLADPWPG